ncbi:unnamed protein product [Amoebophrya sp. A25]|nr:unnamed protein product [Amoebophrya sp. A25]|eukprot:GSA25T00014009001.1
MDEGATGPCGRDAPPRPDQSGSWLSWDEYFMYTAMLSADRAKDPSTQVGACIVNSDNRIIGIGYNGFPRVPQPEALSICSRMCSDLLEEWKYTSWSSFCNFGLLDDSENILCSPVVEAKGGTHNSAACFPASTPAVVETTTTISSSSSKPSKDKSLMNAFEAPSSASKSTTATSSKATTAANDQDEIDGVEQDEKPDGSETSSAPSLSVQQYLFRRLSSSVRQLSRLWEQRVDHFRSSWHRHSNNDSAFPWAREAPLRSDTKYPYVMHAEANAILNKTVPIQRRSPAGGGQVGVSSSTSATASTLFRNRIYSSLFPCHDCAKLVIQAGIEEVIYLSDKHAATDSARAARRLFQLAGVQCREFVPPSLVGGKNSKWFFRGGQSPSLIDHGNGESCPLERVRANVDQWKVAPIIGEGSRELQNGASSLIDENGSFDFVQLQSSSLKVLGLKVLCFSVAFGATSLGITNLTRRTNQNVFGLILRAVTGRLLRPPALSPPQLPDTTTVDSYDW